MSERSRRATLEEDGWTLVSAEERHASHPQSFHIPPRDERESLSPGDAAKLLFDIETREDGRVMDRGVDRMWVIVRRRGSGDYIGVLDNDPGTAMGLKLHEGDTMGLKLHEGDTIAFGPEHVADIDRPSREYIVEKFGAGFFEDSGAD
ncbi:MAG: hypothetical protein ACREMK_06135 [Gemmatimonadota bacterium]